MPLTWHLPWASLTYHATTCSWHSPLPAYAASSAWIASLSGSKNGARNWRREASSNSCLLCSSFHLESRLAEFKHTSAIISGDYHLQIPVLHWLEDDGTMGLSERYGCRSDETICWLKLRGLASVSRNQEEGDKPRNSSQTLENMMEQDWKRVGRQAPDPSRNKERIMEQDAKRVGRQVPEPEPGLSGKTKKLGFFPFSGRRLFFSCVCLLASMARSVNCLVQKKRKKLYRSI